mmetsp:Transcript_65081/g.190403  ORF Transcript_65081/g.190403 Transcript_65081/m.190403 type:complete len:309 (+) Transcript_65081:1868-2794(+)
MEDVAAVAAEAQRRPAAQAVGREHAEVALPGVGQSADGLRAGELLPHHGVEASPPAAAGPGALRAGLGAEDHGNLHSRSPAHKQPVFGGPRQAAPARHARAQRARGPCDEGHPLIRCHVVNLDAFVIRPGYEGGAPADPRDEAFALVDDGVRPVAAPPAQHQPAVLAPGADAVEVRRGRGVLRAQRHAQDRLGAVLEDPRVPRPAAGQRQHGHAAVPQAAGAEAACAVDAHAVDVGVVRGDPADPGAGVVDLQHRALPRSKHGRAAVDCRTSHLVDGGHGVYQRGRHDVAEFDEGLWSTRILPLCDPA